MSPSKPLKRCFSDTNLGMDDGCIAGTAMMKIEDPVIVKDGQMLDTTPHPSQPLPLSSDSTNSFEPTASIPTMTPGTATVAPIMPSQMPPANAANAPKKRIKLTDAEKEAKRLEREAKDMEKAVQKSKREEEKRRKDEEKVKKEEEKRVKENEKEKKRLEREEQAKQKEAEKKKKEEEKEKKQKSQLRLNAFFVPPGTTNNDSTPSSANGSPSPTLSRRGSVSSIPSNEALLRDRSCPPTPSKTTRSPYERKFPAFYLKAHTELAPLNRFERDLEGLHFARRNLDEKLSDSERPSETKFNASRILHLPPYKRRKIEGPQHSVKEIVAQLHGDAMNPIDLTESGENSSTLGALDLLKKVSTRVLRFAEDVRPPYVGTFTRLRDPSTARRICRKPFARVLPATDYDYDSEAEWEEPGEGEDLDSEGEEDAESEDGDDMDGFLDDEDMPDGSKRRVITSNLEPTSSRMCWVYDDKQQVHVDMEQYRLEVILENHGPPINPYSANYWPVIRSTTGPSSRPTVTAMDPPRVPLNLLDGNYMLTTQPPTGLGCAQVQPSSKLKGPIRMVDPEILDAFKQAISGSDLTKVGLVEILKRQFPKQTKDAIKDTLNAVADQVKAQGKGKVWVIKTSATERV
ncbi:MAG: hypothetical protein Q9174_004520 [Haloplaca sp. 1 TL-2023]